MPRSTLPLAALPALLLAACANPGAERAIAARTALVGLPKPALLACAGVPERTIEEDGVEYYTYVAGGRRAAGPAATIGIGGGTDGVGIGLGVPIIGGGGVVDETCAATFVLQGGVVREVRYRPGGDVGDCAPIVSGCLAG